MWFLEISITPRRLNFIVLAGCIAAVPIAGHAQPIGDEFRVNSTTANHQLAPDVAMDASGNFAVVFENTLPVTVANVSVQRYNAAGEPVGDEFLVNTTQNTDHTFPAIDMTPNGNFVVAWQDFGDDGSGTGVFAQRYNAAGQAQGANIPVNTTTTGAQSRADIAIADSNNFVVVWEDVTAGNNKRGIRGQRFNAAGVAQGSEFDISADLDIDHTYPKVVMDPAGNFVVGWSSGNVGANQDVVFRRFDLNGVAQGMVTKVNVTTKMDSASGVTNNMSIGSDDKGNFVVAWQADNFSGPGVPGQTIGILARRYNSTGAPLGDAFEVNTDQPSDAPEVAVAPNGVFAITYEAPDGSLSGVRAHFYSAAGISLGTPAEYNTTTQLVQGRPAIALDGNNKGVVVWRASNNQDGDLDGVYARLLRYDTGGAGGNRVLRVCLLTGACDS